MTQRALGCRQLGHVAQVEPDVRRMRRQNTRVQVDQSTVVTAAGLGRLVGAGVVGRAGVVAAGSWAAGHRRAAELLAPDGIAALDPLVDRVSAAIFFLHLAATGLRRRLRHDTVPVITRDTGAASRASTPPRRDIMDLDLRDGGWTLAYPA